MKIQIITEREIKETDFWNWAECSILAMNQAITEEGIERKLLTKADFIKLLEKGEMSFGDNLGYTKAKTTYKILKE